MALFERCLELPDEERRQLLGAADEAVRDEVERLLAVEAAADRHFAELGSIRQSVLDPTRSGRRLGPYKLLQPIGEGGASIVYEAMRADDAYEKRVAIKMLRFAFGSEELERRFRTERQILAALDHPHIAKLFDGGTTEEGEPYLVMERIDGEPIDRYCERHDLPLEERLELFEKVAGAVSYAHRNLIVHRDLKPSNILVDNAGQPKLLDFGIAKLLHPALYQSGFLPTRHTVRLMTPEYASPEQIRGEPVTTASDVYSLGVVLYLLLTGARPYDLESHSLVRLIEVVCEQEVARPSQSARAASTRERSRALEGDLDTIVLQALRKEPQRRYRSVEAMLEDLRRYEEGLPIEARRPTVAYRASKFVRRNPLNVGLGALAAGLGVSLLRGVAVQTRKMEAALEAEEAARREAEKQEAKAQAINDFLLETLGSADLEVEGPAITVVQALDRAVGKIDEKLKDQPEIAAAVREMLGRTFCSLERFEEAEALLREALAAQRELFAGDHPDTARTLESLGILRHRKGELVDAEGFYTASLAMRQQLVGHEHPAVATTLQMMGSLLLDRGDLPASGHCLRRALDIQKGVVAKGAVLAVADTLGALGGLSWQRGNLDQAERYFRDDLETTIRATTSDHTAIAAPLNNLSTLLAERGAYRESVALARRAVALLEKNGVEDSHSIVGKTKLALALALIWQGQFDDAEELILNVRTHHSLEYKGTESVAAFALNHLGILRQEQRRYAEAEEAFRDSASRRECLSGEAHFQTAASLEKLGTILHIQGKNKQADPILARALDLYSALAPMRWEIGRVKSVYGACLHFLDRDEEAEPLLREGLQRLEEVLGPEHRFTRKAKERLSFCRDRRDFADVSSITD